MFIENIYNSSSGLRIMQLVSFNKRTLDKVFHLDMEVPGYHWHYSISDLVMEGGSAAFNAMDGSSTHYTCLLANYSGHYWLPSVKVIAGLKRFYVVQEGVSLLPWLLPVVVTLV